MPLVRPALPVLFTLVTAEPDAPFHIAKLLYTRGRFALRTTFSHIEVRNFRVYRLQ